MSAAKLKISLAVGFVATVLISILIGQLVFVLERTFPSRYSSDLRLPSAEHLITGSDKPGGLMFSLTLGLFVLVGVALRSMPQPRLFSTSVIATAGSFLAASIFSVYMGFMARMVALYYASFPEPSSIGIVGTFLLLQAIGVAASGLAAILVLMDLLAPTGAATTDAAGDTGETASLKPPIRRAARKSKKFSPPAE